VPYLVVIFAHSKGGYKPRYWLSDLCNLAAHFGVALLVILALFLSSFDIFVGHLIWYHFEASFT